MRRNWYKSKQMKGLCLSLSALMAVSGTSVYAEDLTLSSGSESVIEQTFAEEDMPDEVILDEEGEELENVWEGELCEPSTEGMSAGEGTYEVEDIPADELIEIEDAADIDLADGASGITGTGTKENPYRINNWVDLEQCFEDAVMSDGQVFITLTGDCVVPDDVKTGRSFLYLWEDSDIVLDLNGHTIDRDFKSESDWGMCILNWGTLVIKDSSAQGTGLITGGFGRSGAAIQNNGTLTIQGVTISGNKAEDSLSKGGAITNSGTLMIEGCTIEDNSSIKGGAIYNGMKAKADNEPAVAIIKNCRISGNKASKGGGIYNTGIISIYDTEITQNDAVNGGGVYCESNTVTIGGNTVIADNIDSTMLTIRGNDKGTDVTLGKDVGDEGFALKVEPGYSGRFGIYSEIAIQVPGSHSQVTSDGDTDYQKAFINTHIFANDPEGNGEYVLEYEKNHIYLYKKMDIAYWEIQASNTDVVYDGKEHGISVSVAGSVEGSHIQYADLTGKTGASTAAGEVQYSDVNPTFTEVGTYKVGYRITAEKYNSVTGYRTVTINPKEITEGDLTVTGVDTVYDGREHGITVKVSDDIKNPQVLYKVISENGEELEDTDDADDSGDDAAEDDSDGADEDTDDSSDDADEDADDSDEDADDEDVDDSSDDDADDEDVDDADDSAEDDAEETDEDDEASDYAEENPTFTDAGTYEVGYIVKADNHISYEGTMKIVIRPKEIHESGFHFVKKDATIYFDGSAKKPAIIVKDGKTIISEDEYTVSYSSNIYAGTATITVKDVQGGNYIISGKKTFTIHPVQIRDFETLKAKITKAGKTSQTIHWNQLDDADGYYVYRAKCNKAGKAYAYTLQEDVSADRSSIKMSKLKKASFYKYYVAAYKITNGKKVIYKKSMTIHGATKGGKYGTIKSVKIEKVGKKKTASISLRQGKSAAIKASEVYGAGKKDQHRMLRYESDNTGVASVNANGRIKAVGKGTCRIYVVAQNGVYKMIKVTVK